MDSLRNLKTIDYRGIRVIKTGGITISTVAAEIFAGASKLANRYLLGVLNEGPDIMAVGDSSLAVGVGWLLYPGDSVELTLDPTVVVPIYGISQGSSNARVVELA